jgi:transposase
LLADGRNTTACLAQMHWARGLGLLRGFGGFLRDIFQQRGWYEDRRTLQITASIAVAVVVMVLVAWGLLWSWHYIKRYRLAVGFAGLTVGFGIIRFISLHEVDAWDASALWARTVVDLVAGGKRRTDMRAVMNGVMYILSTGCQWRYIPKDFPPRSTLHDYFTWWNCDGTLNRIHHALYVECRERAEREASPTACIIDSQSVKSAEKGAQC